jgi:AcrR family transcriptional regulator
VLLVSITGERTSTPAEPPTSPDRRSRRRQRLRSEIAEAAVHLAIERGYENVTVDDIAAAVDIAPRTFFRYFASKDEVLFTDYDDKLERLRESIRARPADEPILTSVRIAVLSLAESFEHDREQMMLKAQLMDTPALRARSIERQADWHGVVAGAIAARTGVDPASDLPSQVVAATTLAALQAALRVWIADGGKQDARVVASDALDLLDGGLQSATVDASAR